MVNWGHGEWLRFRARISWMFKCRGQEPFLWRSKVRGRVGSHTALTQGDSWAGRHWDHWIRREDNWMSVSPGSSSSVTLSHLSGLSFLFYKTGKKNLLSFLQYHCKDHRPKCTWTPLHGYSPNLQQRKALLHQWPPASLMEKHMRVGKVLCYCGRMLQNPPFLLGRGHPGWVNHWLGRTYMHLVSVIAFPERSSFSLEINGNF